MRNPHDTMLLQHLDDECALLGRHVHRHAQWAYDSPTHFLREHGQFWGAHPRPAWLPLGAPTLCYDNALKLAEWFDLQYVEGRALLRVSHETIITLPHAWVATASGVAYEVTTEAPWLSYFGMAFSVARADDATWYGDACILDDWRREHPLLRQRWTGEVAGAPSQHYRPSLPLRILRTRKAQGHTLFGAKALGGDHEAPSTDP